MLQSFTIFSQNILWDQYGELGFNSLMEANCLRYVPTIIHVYVLWLGELTNVVRTKMHINPLTGGAGSEVWNRVYMIAPVKKFGRVRLSTIFLQNKYGGECRHGRTMSFGSVLSFVASKHQE